ncbi:MAG: methyltransferase domain-containing protein, partial [Candidatus Thorarchaeota archaeon]
ADVVGIDISETMISRAKENAASHNVTPVFILGEMTDFQSLVSNQYNLILCLGNSLALLENFKTLEKLISLIYNSLTDDGLFIAQALNFEEIHRSGFRFFPQKVGRMENGEEVVFSRFYDHTDPPSSSTLVMTSQMKEQGEWKSRVSTQKVLNLTSEVMVRYLAQAGFQETKFYSNYSESLFVGSDDRNMVIYSRR